MQTVLITGAAKRIGRALALSFAQSGWSVAVHYNASEKEALTLVDEIRSLGQKACAVAAELAEESEVLELFPKVQEVLGRVDLLINNAAVFDYDTVATATRQSWNRHMDINLRAPFILAQQFVQQTATGVIINIIDSRVRHLTANYVSYTVSKAGLFALTQMMAAALGPHFRVNAIAPGAVLPEARESREKFDSLCQASFLKHPVDVADICRAAHFIWESKSLTGEMIVVDCGAQL